MWNITQDQTQPRNHEKRRKNNDSYDSTKKAMEFIGIHSLTRPSPGPSELSCLALLAVPSSQYIPTPPIRALRALTQWLIDQLLQHLLCYYDHVVPFSILTEEQYANTPTDFHPNTAAPGLLRLFFFLSLSLDLCKFAHEFLRNHFEVTLGKSHKNSQRPTAEFFTVKYWNAKGERHSTAAGHLQSFNWSTLFRQGSSASSSSSSSSVQQVTRKTGLLVECRCCAFRFRLSVLFANKILPCIPLLTTISLFLFSIQVSSSELDKTSHSQGQCWVWDHPPHPSFPVR